MKRLIVLTSVILNLLLATSATAENRSFHLGLADNPHDRRVTAIQETWNYIATDSDMIVYHDDRNGIPWTEAYWDLPYPEDFQGKIDLRKSAQVHLWNTHKRYLAVSPINFTRDNIADQFDKEKHPDWQAFWTAQPFNSTQVKLAYYKHLVRLIDAYQPHYLAFAVEANLLLNQNRVDLWPGFVELCQFIYIKLKQDYPDIKLMISFQAEGFHKGFTQFANQPFLYALLMSQLYPYTDYMAVSSYPYTDFASADAMPVDYFTRMAALTPNKPFVIAETGWPAEPVVLSNGYTIYSNPIFQRQYFHKLFVDVQSVRGELVNSLLPRDYDALWLKEFQYAPDHDLLRLWRDMGLYAGDGSERPVLSLWRYMLSRDFAR